EVELTARRAQLRWAHLEPDGEGLAGLDDAIVHVAPDGSLSSVPSPRRDLVAPPVRIGATFWGIRRKTGGAALVRLWPEPLDGPEVSAGETVLAADFIVERRGGALAIDRLTSDGRSERVARVPSPFDGAFLAAGAVVAGE